MKFGVEIEAYGVYGDRIREACVIQGVKVVNERYNHQTQRYWKIVPDSSIYGYQPFEIVSPPLKGEAGLKRVEKVCNILESLGASTNSSCGLHVHVDASDLTFEQMKNIAKGFIKYESTFDSFVTPERRGSENTFCKSNASRFESEADAFRQIDATQDLDELITIMNGKRDAYDNRYFKLNMAALWRHGTIEFRQHHGTVNYETIASWIRFCINFVEVAKKANMRVAKIEMTPEESAKRFFKLITQCYQVNADLCSYYRNRRRQLAA